MGRGWKWGDQLAWFCNSAGERLWEPGLGGDPGIEKQRVM